MEKLKVRIEEPSEHVSFLENISYYILMVTAFLLPIFIIPSPSFPFQFSKSIFISLSVILAFLFWIIARLKDGRYLLPNNIIFGSSGVVIAVLLLSTLFSSVIRISLIGQGYEVDTWVSILLLFVMMFLFSVLFRPRERVFYLYLALFASSLILVAFHALRFAFGPSFLGFGILTDIASNLIGKWNDLGIFFALVTMLSMMTVELLPLGKFFKSLLVVIFGISLLSLVVINFKTVWFALAAFSTLFFIYNYSLKSQDQTDSFSYEPVQRPGKLGSFLAMAVLAVSIVFIVDSYVVINKTDPSTNTAVKVQSPISSSVAKFFKIQSLEVTPGWSLTLDVAKSALQSNPILGVGPNRFINEWTINKPAAINNTVFWNADFNFGTGILPTFVVTSGLLGLVAWLGLLFTILFTGLKTLLMPVLDPLSRYLSVSSFFASAFLWTFFIFYIPSNVILAYTFLFTGVFIASIYNEKLVRAKVISFVDEPRVRFVSVLVLVGMLSGVLILGFVFGNQLIASADFQKALRAGNGGNIKEAETFATRALNLSQSDIYDRFMVEIDLAKMNALLQNQQAKPDDLKDLLGSALYYGQQAIQYDKTDYNNWVSLGRVYEAVVPLNVQGAYENAMKNYDQAVSLNPQGPDIYLMKARLELASGNKDLSKAETYVQTALKLKSDYTEAVYLLSQIQVSEGKLKEAISSADAAAQLAPNDPTVFFQVGLLKYNNNDFKGAITALERAVSLAPDYANAKYFLGLSYDKIGRVQDAVALFRQIEQSNPGNKDVKSILENITAGRDPFASAPKNEQPQNRKDLPLSGSR